MQRAEIVLSTLSQRSQKLINFKFERLYRQLYNKDLYNLVMNNRGIKIDNKDLLDNVIDKIRFERLNLGVFSSEEIDLLAFGIGAILEALYGVTNLRDKRDENIFPSKESFHFIKSKFVSCNWIIKIDLYQKEKENESNINKDYGIRKVLEKKILDQRFLNLIDKLLEYFNEDCSAKINANSKEYFTSVLMKVFMNEITIIAKNKFGIFFKHYSYGTEIIIGLIASKIIALHLKEEIVKLLDCMFDNAKKVSNVIILDFLKKRIDFAGFEIVKFSKKHITILMPARIINMEIGSFKRNNKVVHRGDRINLPVAKIYKEFMKDYFRISQYYFLSDNFKVRIKKYKYYHKLSLLKTIARKEKVSIKKVISRYGKSLFEKAY